MNFKIKYSHSVDFDVLTAVIMESYIVWVYIPEGRTPCCNSVGEFISKFTLPKLSGICLFTFMSSNSFEVIND
jgi:hypothetical protein